MFCLKFAQFVFNRSVYVHVGENQATALNVYGYGSCAEESSAQLCAQLQATIQRYLRAYTSDLTPEERNHKRLLLGAVDVIASKLDAPSNNCWSYYGDIVEIDGNLYFKDAQVGHHLIMPTLMVDGNLVLQTGDFCIGRFEDGVLVSLKVIPEILDVGLGSQV